MPRHTRTQISTAILATMLAIRNLFKRSKIIDGSILRPVLKSGGVANESLTKLRQKMLVKLSYSEAVKQGHKPADGKRGVYYRLKTPNHEPDIATATKIYEQGHIPQSHLNRQVKAILLNRKVKTFTYKNNKLTITFLS
jgi:hypothetical protein